MYNIYLYTMKAKLTTAGQKMAANPEEIPLPSVTFYGITKP